ncbi:Hypothetical protein SRAE_1000121550 [Strongyloides ratti]|uniref:Uncharacterized protein n=1 Tax=Strongyloides ratti TaxID=34506 RepID=A0A090L605_STRRB|nr:Hypothetical protein SRAE_1000121550 [Strongyloides ratti]CEF62949.1 Hypothetical protein SRAE_1000121550 [Strongyloides ratti]
MKKSTFDYPSVHVDSKLPIEDQKEHTLSKSYYELKKLLDNYKEKSNNNNIMNKVNENNKNSNLKEEKNFQDDSLKRTIIQIERFKKILKELREMGINM